MKPSPTGPRPSSRRPACRTTLPIWPFWPDGSLACVSFGGTVEGMGDISVWMSRLPAGAGRWGQAIRLTDDREQSEQNPILFQAPDGRFLLFHTSQPGGRQEECEILMRTSLDGGASFGPSERLGDFRGVFVRQPLHIGPITGIGRVDAQG